MMAIRVEHELHRRRMSRNMGLLVVLLVLIGVIFGLTVAKISVGQSMEAFDHTPRPQLAPADQ